MSSEKPHRIRVKVNDGKRREWNKLRGQLGSHLDVIDAKDGIEFVVCAINETHLDQVRAKLAAAGLEEIPGGDTDVSRPAPVNTRAEQRRGQGSQPRASHGSASANPDKLKPKPYGFVPLADEPTSAPPVWHDGTGTEGRLSGEIRCEIETLTPLLVGWERRPIDDAEQPWPVPHVSAGDDKVELAGVVTIKSKSVLCPLRAPWGDRPVLIPGDSLKGLLRHELGALLGAPMERVAERSYSYRPNSLFPNAPNPRLVARLARVADDSTEMRPLCPSDRRSQRVRVPVRLDLLPENLKYDRDRHSEPPRYRFDDRAGGSAYRGGQGAGDRLNSKRRLHETLEAVPASPTTSVKVPEAVQAGYLNTLRHLIDPTHGHFGERHPDVPTTITGDYARRRILHAASNVVFQPGDMIWVEWDTRNQCIVSLGWHYYYRWAYTDTVRKKRWADERPGLFALDAEKASDATGAPAGLSAVRRLFGYTGDNEGNAGIGKGDHAQLMGRISVNAAVEVIEPGNRFLPPTFLKELGMPRPSAVEHYLEQPHHPSQRSSDRANLVTYAKILNPLK